MNKKQDFYCENCFKNEDIKQFIRKNGEPLKKEFKCSYCWNENYVCESDIFYCIQEYIDNECMVKKRKKAGSQEEFEDYLEDYLDECEKECQEKYEEKCKQENIEPIYIIDQKKLANKLKSSVKSI
jgi:predicted HicB family RNase H-like nuclease